MSWDGSLLHLNLKQLKSTNCVEYLIENLFLQYY